MSREMQSSHSHSFPFLSSAPMPVVSSSAPVPVIFFYNHNSPSSHFSFSNSSNSSASSFLQFPDRVLPRLPPFAFGEREILPASWDTAAVGEIPLQLYRHQRLRRAMGELPSHIILPQRYRCQSRALLNKAVVRVSFAVV